MGKSYRLLISLLLALILSTILPGMESIGSPAVSNVGRQVGVGYLLRENFPSMYAGLSGWESKNWTHGSGYSTSVISSSSTSKDVSLSKKFLPQKNTVITTEFRLLLLESTNGGEIKLQDGLNDRITLQINNNQLQYLQRNGQKTNLKELDFGVWNGVRIIADISSGTVDIYIDGRLAVTGALFTAAGDTLSRIHLGISTAGTGSYSLGTLEIHKGFAVKENLVSTPSTHGKDASGNLLKGYPVRTGANNWAVSDNNTSTAYLGNDGKSSTTWEGNPLYNNALYVVDLSGSIAKLNQLVLEVPNPASGNINFNYLNPSGQWTGIRFMSVTPSSYINNRLVLDFDTIYAKQVAVTFHSGFPSVFVPKITEFQGFFNDDSGLPPQPNLPAPADWIVEAPVSSSHGEIEVFDIAGYTAGQEFAVFRLSDRSPGHHLKLTKNFSLQGSSTFEFQMNLSSHMEAITRIAQSNGNEIKITARGQDIFFSATGMSGEKKILSGYRTNLWYRFQILYSAADNSVIVNTNGFEAASGKIAAGFSSGTFESISFSTTNATTGTVMIDDIKIGPQPQRGVVPVPKPLDTGDYIINMQVCNLWREGSHYGWQAFDGTKYGNIKPLLGWYDEGDPEVTDWSIKWALEHGISSFMYCWYRPDNGPIPVKESIRAEEYWDGHMNAQYKDMLKFTIMFTNHGGTKMYSADDMLENLMPYWIEAFFKNPNYLKTSDNKPILYIYQNSDMLKYVGDTDKDGVHGKPADVKVLLDKMRQMCVDAGFGGLVIATEYRGDSHNVITTLSNSGYDYIFAYTWHPTSMGMSNDAMLTQIKGYLNWQKQYASMYNNGRTRIMPNASISWDPRPWRELAKQNITPYYTFDLAHFQRQLEWIRDDFQVPVIDPAGNKMIMMDNWNEFGEGHYMMPNYNIPAYKDGKTGFGYLDVIRAVFGTTPFHLNHEDIHPLEAGYGPYDKWYPPAWTQNHQPNFPVPVDNSLNITPTVAPSPSSQFSSGQSSAPSHSSGASGVTPGGSAGQSALPSGSSTVSGDESLNGSNTESFDPNDPSQNESVDSSSDGSMNSDGNEDPGTKNVWPLFLMIGIIIVVSGSGVAAYFLIGKKKAS